MRVIDMHLNALLRPDLNRVAHVTLQELRGACERYEEELGGQGRLHGVMVVLNPGVLDEPNAEVFFRSVHARKCVALSFSVDFRAPQAFEQLERAHQSGVRALKFHPYIQKIQAEDFVQAGDLASHAERLGMFLMVCCSYGTRDLGRYSGISLASYFSERISCPIVLSHAGGARVLDALLVAADTPNLFLDTSFSLSYYLGSSVESDFAFSMKKLGADRWVYGSDAPFVSPKEALEVTLRFFDRHGFAPADIDKILYQTACGILE